MCYSAMVEKAYRQYVREFGAAIDLPQFTEVYGWTITDAAVPIPRAVDRWFDEMDGDEARQIRKLIEQRDRAVITKLEGEMFAQKRRLADAERKLASKPTKAATESKRIAGDKIVAALARLDRLKSNNPAPADARIFPMHFAPIVLEAGGQRVIRLARYHCRQPGKPAAIDRKYPGLYNARRDNLERFWREQFGATHAVMLVESFYENVQREGVNRVLHFVPKPAELMRVACLYAEWIDPKSGRSLLSFAAVTDQPPAEVAAAGHDRCIVNLSPAAVDKWLTPQGRSDAELQGLLDDRARPYYEHELLAA